MVPQVRAELTAFMTRGEAAWERERSRDDSAGVDVIKVFTEEPVGLEALAPDADPDARRREGGLSTLESLLSPDARPYARAYLAGTDLGPPRRVGLTALDDAEAWLRPLLAWAGDRPWAALGPDGSARTLDALDVADKLRQPGDLRVLAVGLVPPGALADAVSGARREALPALRSLLDAGAAVLFPEPAFDGRDWSLFARAPLRDPLADAFRQHPAADARRLFAPYRRARGEHTFYLEQWALDALPDWAEEV